MRPLIWENNTPREMTDEEHAELVATGWTAGSEVDLTMEQFLAQLEESSDE